MINRLLNFGRGIAGVVSARWAQRVVPQSGTFRNGQPYHFRNFVRVVASGIALALSGSIAIGSPLADSAVGTGTVLGNSSGLNSPATQLQDPEWAAAKHTPTGQMFKIPFAVPRVEDLHKTASGWEYSGQVEFGFLHGDADEQNARYRMYQDPDNGAFLNNFSLQMQKPEGAYSIEVTGGAAGQHDQYYGLQFGRTNAWKVKLFFSETPHVFTHRYRSLWTGVGTGNLMLLPPLTPGGTTSNATDNANVAAVALNAPPSTLSLTRKKIGARIDVDLSKTWKAYLAYSLERREGARPFGAVWGNAGGTAPIEIPEPIDYETHAILAGVQFAGELNAFNLRLSASLFENKIDTLTFQNPYRIAPPPGMTTAPAAGAYTQGQFDLVPSNEAYNARAEYTRSLPNFYRGFVTLVVAAGTWRQNDSLIPYTTIPGLTVTNVSVLPGGSWDTTGALSRKSTEANVDTLLSDLTFSFNPTEKLNLKLKGRFSETDHKTAPFLAVNPNAVYLDADSSTAGNQTRGLTFDGVTGVWGRLPNDGSGQNILMGTNANPAGNIPIKSTIYSSEQLRFGPTAEYRLGKVSSLNANVEREITRRENRVRKRTWEDKFKVGYVNRGLGNSSLRLSYEFAQRRGDPYYPSYYDGVFSSAIAPIPTTAGANVTSWAARNNSGIRTFDLADRDRHVVNARLDTMLRPNLDAGVSIQARESDYPASDYGRKKQSNRSFNLDLNYQPSPRQTVYGYYSYELGRNRQRAIANGQGTVTIGLVTALGIVTPDNAIAIGSAPDGPVYPLLNAWKVDSTDRNHLLGVGFKQEIGKVSLNLDYSYSTARTRIEYDYTVGGAINAANAVFAGNRMPDLATDVNYLDASLRIPLTERISARLVGRYQKETIRDWHYQKLDLTPVVLGANANVAPAAVILDAGPQTYRVNWFGVIFQVKL